MHTHQCACAPSTHALYTCAASSPPPDRRTFPGCLDSPSYSSANEVETLLDGCSSQPPSRAATVNPITLKEELHVPDAVAYRLFVRRSPEPRGAVPLSSAPNRSHQQAGPEQQPTEPGCPHLHTLHSTLRQCAEIAASIASSYMWHCDPFHLAVVHKCSPASPGPGLSQHPASSVLPECYLAGLTTYGDNVEDEWFIVYILSRLSAAIPGLIVQVIDSVDGDILLIEAADVIPHWISPENSRNRVFFLNGKVHILPLSVPTQPAAAAAATVPASKARASSSSPRRHPRGSAESLYRGIALSAANLSVWSAVQVLRDLEQVPREQNWSLASSKVQQAIAKRLEAALKQSQSALHTVQALLPATVAHLLHFHPWLVSDAVRAFFLRDSLDAATYSKMARFTAGTMPATAELLDRLSALPPTTTAAPPVENQRVLVNLPMTRCMYAQLSQQRFRAPRVFGTAPPPSSPVHKAFDLGVKLACGFEILYARSKAGTRSPPSHATLLTNPARLEPDAASSGALLGGFSVGRPFALPNLRLFLDSCAQQDFDLHHLRRLPLRHEDPDTWMELNPSDLDKNLLTMQNAMKAILQESEKGFAAGSVAGEPRRAATEKSRVADGDSSDSDDGEDGAEDIVPLANLLKRMKGFLGQSSDFEGVEMSAGDSAMDAMFDDPASSEDDLTDEEESEEEESEEEERDAQTRSGSDTIRGAMAEMDAELAGSMMARSFTSAKDVASALRDESPAVDRPGAEGGDGSKMQFSDQEINLVVNMARSAATQPGLPGPAMSLLASLSSLSPHNM